jgi:hypothetical protein
MGSDVAGYYVDVVFSADIFYPARGCNATFESRQYGGCYSDINEYYSPYSCIPFVNGGIYYIRIDQTRAIPSS